MGLIKEMIKLKQSLPAIMIVVGGLGFVLFSWDPFGFEISHERLYKFFYDAFTVIIMSALVSFLIDSVEFMGVFRRALEDIIYDSKFLKKRRDINDIWVNVSKEMFMSKFPQISDSLTKTVGQYLKIDDGLKLRYFEDYVNSYKLSLDETDKGIINVVNIVTLTLNVEDDKNFNFPLNITTCAREENKDKAKLEIKNVSVNGKDVKVEVPEPEYKKNVLNYESNLPLGGATKYKIKMTITKRYNLQDDSYLAFQAKWLVCGMRVKVFYPKELGILFVNRGVMGTFEPGDDNFEPGNGKEEGFMEFECKSMILKKQGYILTITPKMQL